MGRWLFSCAGLLMLVCGCHRSSPPQQAHSKASLIIEQPAVTPGSKVDIGILFVMDAGWHIYWQNPGDSGEPPRIQWQLPAGIAAEALQWPTPIRLRTTAGTDYGYQGETVLLSSLQIPMQAQLGTIEVGGELRWLVCRDICVPQSAHLEAPVQIAGSASMNASAHQLLQSAAGRLPIPLPASYRPEAANSPDGLRLTLVAGRPVTQAEFFPADEAVIDNGAPQELAEHGGTVSLTLNKSEYLRRVPEHLKGVLVLNGRDAYRVDAPIHASNTHKGSRWK